MPQDQTPLPFPEYQVKHLEFIQAVISRLSNGSFLVKGWTLTVLTAFFGFFIRDLNWKMAMVAAVPVIGFWMLDAYFLRQERLFRKLYDEVRRPECAVPPFSMDTRNYTDGVRFSGCVLSPVMINFYGSLTFVNVLLIAGGSVQQ